jgi:hypothetical protein
MNTPISKGLALPYFGRGKGFKSPFSLQARNDIGHCLTALLNASIHRGQRDEVNISDGNMQITYADTLTASVSGPPGAYIVAAVFGANHDVNGNVFPGQYDKWLTCYLSPDGINPPSGPNADYTIYLVAKPVFLRFPEQIIGYTAPNFDPSVSYLYGQQVKYSANFYKWNSFIASTPGTTPPAASWALLPSVRRVQDDILDNFPLTYSYNDPQNAYALRGQGQRSASYWGESSFSNPYSNFIEYEMIQPPYLNGDLIQVAPVAHTNVFAGPAELQLLDMNTTKREWLRYYGRNLDIIQ